MSGRPVRLKKKPVNTYTLMAEAAVRDPHVTEEAVVVSNPTEAGDPQVPAATHPEPARIQTRRRSSAASSKLDKAEATTGTKPSTARHGRPPASKRAASTTADAAGDDIKRDETASANSSSLPSPPPPSASLTPSTDTTTNKRPRRSSAATKKALNTKDEDAPAPATPRKSDTTRGGNKGSIKHSDNNDTNDNNNTKKKRGKSAAKTKVSKPSLEDLLTSPNSPLIQEDLKKLIQFGHYKSFTPEERASLEELLPSCIKQQTKYFANGQLTEGFFKYCYGFSDFLVEWQDALAASFFTEEYERKARRARLKQQRMLQLQEAESAAAAGDVNGHQHGDTIATAGGKPVSEASSTPSLVVPLDTTELDDLSGDDDDDADPSTWEQWKDEAYEEYYGEKAFRHHEKDAVAGESAKLLFPKLGHYGALEVGDQMRFRWDYEFEVDAAEAEEEERREKEREEEEEKKRRAAKEEKDSKDDTVGSKEKQPQHSADVMKMETEGCLQENPSISDPPLQLHQINNDRSQSMDQDLDEPVIAGPRQARVSKRKYEADEPQTSDRGTGMGSKRKVKQTATMAMPEVKTEKRKGKETSKEKANAKMKDGLQASGFAAVAVKKQGKVKKVVHVDERVIIVDFATNGRPIVEFLSKEQVAAAKATATKAAAANIAQPQHSTMASVTVAKQQEATLPIPSITATLQPLPQEKEENQQTKQRSSPSPPSECQASNPPVPVPIMESAAASTLRKNHAPPSSSSTPSTPCGQEEKEGVDKVDGSAEKIAHQRATLTYSMSSSSLSSISSLLSNSSMSSLSSSTSLPGVRRGDVLATEQGEEVMPSATEVSEPLSPLASSPSTLAVPSSKGPTASTHEKHTSATNDTTPNKASMEPELLPPLSVTEDAVQPAKETKGDEMAEALAAERYVVDTPGMLVNLIHTVQRTRVPEHVWNVSRKGHGSVDPWKAIEVIRRGCLIGSLFGIRMDLWEVWKVMEQRQQFQHDLEEEKVVASKQGRKTKKRNSLSKK